LNNHARAPLSFREKVRDIIFEADTHTGKLFDVLLIIIIGLSIIAVMLDSVAVVNDAYAIPLYILEWVFTVMFTAEYLVRLWCIGRPMKYATSFFGVVDLLSILPTYISLLFPGTQYMLVVRVIRVLRVFRVLKFVKYVSEADTLMKALRASRRKVVVFLFVVASLVIILGSLMYLIEGGENGFTSIPICVYWAIVTITTVGYGDVSPQTDLGKALASLVMVLGYCILAVPTGIVTAEMTRYGRAEFNTRVCGECSKEGHESDAVHCKYCGAEL
jgi:voltage-gated potassium channel